VIPAARKQDQTNRILLSSIDEIMGALRTYRVNTFKQTIKKNNMAEAAVVQYRNLKK
jgi:hypothetical protein